MHQMADRKVVQQSKSPSAARSQHCVLLLSTFSQGEVDIGAGKA